ncbi:hypothetical protein BGP85_21740 [Pseudomonas putida]|nr:hypothetical protein BGP85_21740 [Pseudomonas putida]
MPLGNALDSFSIAARTTGLSNQRHYNLDYAALKTRKGDREILIALFASEAYQYEFQHLD